MTSRDAQMQAVRASTAVWPLAPGTRGRVLSVHRSAVNIDLGERLLTIAERAAGGLPGGILVENGFAPTTLGIRAGMLVTTGPRHLVIASVLRVRVAGATRWSPTLPTIAPIPADLARRVRVVRSTLDRAGRGGFGGLLAASLAVARFESAARTGDTEAVAVAGDALVGLGAGLTPSGDDLLVGFTASIAAGGHPAARTLAGRWARDASQRTTLVAAAYHRHATTGAYAETLHDLLRAVLTGGDGDIAAAARRLASVGATSGEDALHGVILGLATLAAARRERPAA